jgi:hypothetical protein
LANVKQTSSKGVQSREKGRLRFAKEHKTRLLFGRKGKGIDRVALCFQEIAIEANSLTASLL